FLFRLNVERAVPPINVPYFERAEFGGCVCANQDLLPLRSLTRFDGPLLSVSNEELLLAGQAVMGGRCFATQCSVPGVIGRRKAGIVGDVLAERLLAVHREIRKGAVKAVLPYQRLTRLLEMREIFRCPPVSEAAPRL